MYINHDLWPAGPIVRIGPHPDIGEAHLLSLHIFPTELCTACPPVHSTAAGMLIKSRPREHYVYVSIRRIYWAVSRKLRWTLLKERERERERERESRSRGLYRFTRFSSLEIYANRRIFIVAVTFCGSWKKNNEQNHGKNICSNCNCFRKCESKRKIVKHSLRIVYFIVV